MKRRTRRVAAPPPPPSPVRTGVNRWLGFGPALLWMGVIFFMSSRSHLPGPKGVLGEFQAVAGHIIFYGVLALCLEFGFRWIGFHPLRAAILAVVFAVAFGITDEVHQAFVPGRTPDDFDVNMDAVGAGLFVFGWRWARRKWQQEERKAAAETRLAKSQPPAKKRAT